MIKIEQLTPFMKKGWVAMDKDGSWWWFGTKPEPIIGHYKHGLLEDCWYSTNNSNISYCFDIAPADDWTKSLIQIKGVKR